MSAWTATALVLVITAAMAGAVDAGSCNPKTQRHCADNRQNVDLSAVPDITEKIVGEEPVIKPQNKPLNEPVPAPPYTGPIFGVTSGKRTPTVGYSWSLQ